MNDPTPRPLMPQLRQASLTSLTWLKSKDSLFRKKVMLIYNNLGFIIICMILVVVVGYLSTVAFYVLNRSWTIPLILSPYSEKVVASHATMISTQSKQDELTIQKLQTQNRIHMMENEITTNTHYLKVLKSALDAERASKQKMSVQLQKVFDAYDKVLVQSQKAGLGAASTDATHLQRELELGLIDKNSLFQGRMALNHEMLSQVESDLKRIEMRQHLDDISREIRTIANLEDRAFLENKETGVSPSLLNWVKEYSAATSENERLLSEQAILQEQLQLLNRNIADYNSVMKSISDSPYFQAFSQNVTISFVPYDNLTAAEEKIPVYACSLLLIWCSKVGTVGKVLEGEVQLDHPFFNKRLRGLMVQLNLEQKAGKTEILHLGKKPWAPF